MNITVHIPICGISVDYFLYLRKNYLERAKYPETIQFGVYAFDDWAVEIVKENNAAQRIVKMPHAIGSLAHAQAANFALKNLVKDQINIIADADTAMIKQDWDVWLNIIISSGIHLIGPSYEDIGGFSSGNSKIQTYKNKPTITWLALSPHHDFSNLNMFPDKTSNIEITSEHLSKLYNLPIGYSVLRDVGWGIPQYIEDNSLNFITFSHIKSSNKQCKVLNGTSDYHEEFQLDGEPFLVHQRGSMKHMFRNSELSTNFYQAIENYLKNVI